MTDNKQALVKLTNERIADNNKLLAFVEEAKKFCIPLFPETLSAPAPEYSYGVALVSVNLKLDDYGNNKDIYKNESGGYCLHLTKINEIAQAAKLQITDSRLLERLVDEKTGAAIYILHQIKWKIMNIDGTINEGVATGEYDYYRDREKYIGERVGKDGKPYIAGEKQVKQRRGHAGALAESKAKYRAYNDAIAKLPRSFTLEELSKPFAVPYLIKDASALLKQLPPEQAAQLRLERARKEMGLAAEVYQSPVQATSTPPVIEDASYKDVPAEQSGKIQMKPAALPGEFTSVARVQEVTEDDILTEEEKLEEYFLSLIEAKQIDRTEAFTSLKNKKQLKPGYEKVTIEMFANNTPADQVAFLRRMAALPNVVEALPA
jgi:hypothetical protein